VKYRPAAGEAASRKSKAVSEILLKSLKKMKGDGAARNAEWWLYLRRSSP